MTKEQIKSAFIKLWEVRYLVIGVLLLVVILVLFGSAIPDLSIGFIVTFLLFIAILLIDMLKKKRK